LHTNRSIYTPHIVATMSASSSIRNSLLQVPTQATFASSHSISLIDEERQQEAAEYAEQSGSSEAPTAPPTPGPSPLTKRLTRDSLQLQQSLKREWTRRKYAKYDRGRYRVNDENTNPEQTSDVEASTKKRPGDLSTAQQPSYLDNARSKAKALLKRKRTLGAGTHAQDTVIDILYENQRGMFLFGVPKYSASTLLPSDPKPWQNEQFRTSPVDIRNAQVPDPSWEWVWKGWYVDMSRDVDEEGWEYSFKFHGGGGWHGSHPWFHSFVRRRRWLRMRRRKANVHRTKEKSHELTAEYFTIHPETLRSPPDEGNVSRMGETELARLLREKEQEAMNIENLEIEDIATLTTAMGNASVDRDKLIAVRKFIDNGGDELYYLSERMPEIMALFIYDSSRRLLLSELLQRHGETTQQQKDLKGHSHDDEKVQKDHDASTRRAENLLKAVHAADAQVKELEYYSEIKDMLEHEEPLSAGPTSPTSKGKGKQDLLDPFQSKQDASEGVKDLHAHAEHPDSSKGVKGKESSLYFDSRTKESSTDDTRSAYLTAAESASELKTASKRSAGLGQAGSLDGVLEGGSDETGTAESHGEDPVDPETGLPFQTPPQRPMETGAQVSGEQKGKKGVQIVEPVPEPEDLPSPKIKD
jgi:hypothetical protein